VYPSAEGLEVRPAASTGAYRMALRAGILTARRPNTLAFTITDRASHPLPHASVRVDPWMTAMLMRAPAVVSTAAHKEWVAHPVFGMAGSWRGARNRRCSTKRWPRHASAEHLH
jgi:hypothetical protein